MADKFGVTPQELRATSQHLNDVSGRMSDVLASLRDKLNAEGAAWGDDGIGDQFAKGDSGYLGQLDWVHDSVGAKTDLLDYYSRGLKGGADSFERQDEA